MNGSRLARTANDLVHDWTSGTWPAALLVMFLLTRRIAPGIPATAATALVDVTGLMFRILLVSLVLVLATGALRLRYYAPDTDDDPAARRRAALVRHVLYLVVYGGGTLWAYSLLTRASGRVAGAS